MRVHQAMSSGDAATKETRPVYLQAYIGVGKERACTGVHECGLERVYVDRVTCRARTPGILTEYSSSSLLGLWYY